MTLLNIATRSALLFSLTAGVAFAGDVRVKGVHLCCGACVSDAQKSLKGVEGVTSVSADRDSKLVAFTAADDKAAQSGIEALAKAGFYGTATHGEKEIAFPASGVKKGERVDTLTLTGVHLCCGACVTGAKEALKEVEGLTGIDIDRNDGVVKLTGKNIDAAAAVGALNKGGFAGTVKTK